MSIKLNRPARYFGTHGLAERYIEGVQERDDDLTLEFADYLATEGKLGVFPNLTLDMTVRQIVDKYIESPMGREALKDWAQERAEFELEP